MDIYERLVNYKKCGIACMVVTVIEKSGEGPVTVGKKMLVTEGDEAFGTVGGGAVDGGFGGSEGGVTDER